MLPTKLYQRGQIHSNLLHLQAMGMLKQCSCTCLHLQFCTLVCPCSVVSIFTDRNEVVAKVMFLHLSVILFTGGLPQCMLGNHHKPPPLRRHVPPRKHASLGSPPWEACTPPEACTPRSMHPSRKHACTPWEAHTPLPGKHAPPEACTPLGSTHPPPPEEQTLAYGQWVASTHPTGMQSCSIYCRINCFSLVELHLFYVKSKIIVPMESAGLLFMIMRIDLPC